MFAGDRVVPPAASTEETCVDGPREMTSVCAPGRIRTCDTRFRRAVLYPLSYEGLLLPSSA